MEYSEFKLTRYHEYKERSSDESMFPEPDGEWVKWEDVEPLIKAYLDLTNTKNKRLGFTKIEIIK